MTRELTWDVREPLSEAIGRLSSAEYSIALALAYDSPAVAIDSISTAREKIAIALQLLDAAEALLNPNKGDAASSSGDSRNVRDPESQAVAPPSSTPIRLVPRFETAPAASNGGDAS